MVTWNSSNGTVAGINSVGLATGANPGTTMITASLGAIQSKPATLTVTSAGGIPIVVTPAFPYLAQGMQQQFTATAVLSPSYQQDVTQLAQWNSSNSTVAPINSTGLVTGLAPGSTTITASYQGSSGTTTLTVGPPELVCLAVSPASASIIVGDSELFMATGQYTDGSTQDLTNSVQWGSSDMGVATIGAPGRAIGWNPGTTTITATPSVPILGTACPSTTAVLTVTPATCAVLTISPADPSIAVGNTQQFAAACMGSDGSTQDLTSSPNISWSSDRPSVATICDWDPCSGLSFANGPGTTTISAEYDAGSYSITGSTTLTVTSAECVDVSVTPLNASIELGNSQQFGAKCKFEDGSTQDITQAAQWSAAPGDIALMNNGYGTSGLAESINVGTANITASFEGVQNSPPATLTVTCDNTAFTVSPSSVVLLTPQPPTDNIAGVSLIVSNFCNILSGDSPANSIPWSAMSTVPWLTTNPNTGEGNGSVFVAYAGALSGGIYTGSIVLTFTGSSTSQVTVPVILYVAGPIYSGPWSETSFSPCTAPAGGTLTTYTSGWIGWSAGFGSDTDPGGPAISIPDGVGGGGTINQYANDPNSYTTLSGCTNPAPGTTYFSGPNGGTLAEFDFFGTVLPDGSVFFQFSTATYAYCIYSGFGGLGGFSATGSCGNGSSGPFPNPSSFSVTALSAAGPPP